MNNNTIDTAIIKSTTDILLDQRPVIVSFYGGSEYYYDAGVALRNNCVNLGLECLIEEVKLSESDDWASICRKKVHFYHEKLRELKKPILWVDVDSKISYLPNIFVDAKYDFAAFLRGFNDLTTFNKTKFARNWAPSFLYFNYTDGGLKLTEAIKQASVMFKDSATDDYFLEEGWRSCGVHLTALPLPRKYLSLNDDNPEAAFIFGNSGNVKHFQNQVEQHENENYGNFLATELEKWIRQIKTPAFKKFLYKKATSLVVTDLDALLALGKIGQEISPDDALSFAVRAAYLYPRKYESRKLMAEIFQKQKKKSRYKEILQDLASNEYKEWRHYAQAKLVDYEREERSANIKASFAALDDAPPFKRINMWWAKTPYPGNFGDTLNPYLIEKMTGIPPLFGPRGKGMLAIGSVIKWAQANTDVWGSGTSRKKETVARHAKYHAVRGPITRGVVMANGAYCPEVYGDPALLLPKFYNPKVKKRFRLGYIPHYQHQDIVFDGDAKLIDILRVSDGDMEAFIREILECELILSTSLHGLIVAHAYGVPARWAIHSTADKQVHGDNCKFEDYFLGVGAQVQKPLDLAEFKSLDSSRLSKEVPEVALNFNSQRLIEAFPYPDLLNIS